MHRVAGLAVAVTGTVVLAACGGGDDLSSFESTDEIVSALDDSDYPCEDSGGDDFFSSTGDENSCTIDGEDHPIYVSSDGQSGEDAVNEQSFILEVGTAAVGENWYFDCGVEDDTLMTEDECSAISDTLGGTVVDYGEADEDDE